MKAISPPLSSPQGLLRGVFAILAVLVIAFLSPASVPAFAQNPTGVTSSAEPSSEADPNGGAADSQSGATMLVLDSSGSMLSLIHISEPTRLRQLSRMPSSA